MRTVNESSFAKVEKGLLAFIHSYPGPEWKFLLHEEGCVGTNVLLTDRSDDEECHCGGDVYIEYVEEALKVLK